MRVRFNIIGNNTQRRETFEVRDRKLRSVGALVNIAMAEATESDGVGYGGYEPGLYWSFRPSATRSGVEYGATQPRQYFKTEAEMEAAIAKYFASAKKRALKQFGY